MATFLRAVVVRKKTGLAKTQFYQRIADGTFPKPAARLGPRAPVWLESDIERWIDAQVEGAKRAEPGHRLARRPATVTLLNKSAA